MFRCLLGVWSVPCTTGLRSRRIRSRSRFGGVFLPENETVGGVQYHQVDAEYFEKRGLKRHARVWSLWALGVGAVISGDFFGWNFGLDAGGFGGLFIATVIITVMYIGMCDAIAEMSPALPHTGGAYSFGRSAMGPWGGFITGLAENMEYVLTPAVIVVGIGGYLGAIFRYIGRLRPGLVGPRLFALRGSERLGCRGQLQVHRVHHGGGAGHSADLLRRGRSPFFLGQRSRHRADRGGYPLVTQGMGGGRGGASVRHLVLPGHRRASLGGRGVTRSRKGHAQRHPAGTPDAHCVCLPHPVSERRHRPRGAGSRALGRAPFARLQDHLRATVSGPRSWPFWPSPA